MATTAASAPVTDAPARRSVVAGTLTMMVSATSMPFGAAAGAQAFAALSPAGVVAVRNLVVSLVLLPVARPPLRRMTWAQWWPALTLGLVLVAMNISVATSVERLGVALAITLEFLGPLGVALAGSRSWVDLGCAVAAGAGVYVLVLPGPTSDWVGIGIGAFAALGWAAYILLNRVMGERLPGLQSTAVASSVATLATLPLLIVLLVQGRLVGAPLAYAVTAGVLSSLVPYAADLFSLRRVPARFFGVFMSLNPVMAAVAGLVVLGQGLAVHETIGIGTIVIVNVVATLASVRRVRTEQVLPGV